jgi:meckelin
MLFFNFLKQLKEMFLHSFLSVFVMSHSHFGYYIHGKSPHGASDTDMAGLLGHLQREADDLCGHRGLQAGSDHQSFSMALPLTIRTYYDKVL